MFVRTLADLEELGRVKFPSDKSFRSARFVTSADGFGYSYNENKVAKGTDLTVWLKHHWEANYIISGTGEVTDLTRQEVWPLEAGVLYVVGPNDRHRLRLTEDECHVSVFHPPLTGNETFDADGSYAPSGPIEKTGRRMFVRRVDAMRQTGHEEVTANGQVRTIRMLTRTDDVGFTLSDIRFATGADVRYEEGRRWAANHVASGNGTVTDVRSGQTWELKPGMAYNVERGDQYQIAARTALHILRTTALLPSSDDPVG